MLRLLLASALLALMGCASDTATAPSTTPTLNGTRGVTQGGPQDIAEFRAIVSRGEIPSPTTLDATGFFAEHAFDLPPADCGRAVCLAPMLAVAPRFDGRNWTMGFVALSTSVDPATLPRPPLHLVVAITTAERSASVERGLAAMIAALRPEDRVTLIEPGSYPRVTMFGRPARDVRISLSGAGGTTSGAVYESLAEASQAIDTLPGFMGSARVVLITSGPDNGYVRDTGRIVALGEALARRGVALSVVGTGSSYRAEVPSALGGLGAGTYAFAQSDTDMEQILRAEGETGLTPLATDFRLRVRAATGYRVGRVYGARRTRVLDGVVEFDAPALFIGSRMGSRDVGGGRRGGGGGFFVELIADASMADTVGVGAPAFTAEAAWRDPSDGSMVMTRADARNSLAPGRNPEGMWPAFSDEQRAKVFMMVNLYLALRGAVSFYDEGDCAHARGIVDMMDTSLDGWNRRRPDPDIDADARLLRRLGTNLDTRCRAVTPVQPRDSERYPVGCMFI